MAVRVHCGPWGKKPMKRRLLAIGTFVAVAGAAQAQQGLQRRANLVGGGGPDQGKCTVEVMVDGTAQVEIRGDNATLRDLNGQTPQWRRFECTSPMPANPSNFRFAGVDGRGTQTLVKDPRNGGGSAIVQINDPQGGAEGYTFDVFWGNGPGPGPQDRRDDRSFRDQGGPPPPPHAYDRGRDQYSRGPREGNRFSADEAVRVCQDSVQNQAYDRFRTRNIQFRGVAMDDNPGRNDYVMGDLLVPRRFGRADTYHFSCSVNFGNGQVRTVHIDQFPVNAYGGR
jgi:opacity protein-like surface antigen